MALTKEDLQAISEIMDVKLEPVYIRLDRLESRMDSLENRMGSLENRMDKLENRMDRLESEGSSLKIGQMEIRNSLKAVEEKLSETYQLALDAWGYSVENRTWLEKSRLKV